MDAAMGGSSAIAPSGSRDRHGLGSVESISRIQTILVADRYQQHRFLRDPRNHLHPHGDTEVRRRRDPLDKQLANHVTSVNRWTFQPTTCLELKRHMIQPDRVQNGGMDVMHMGLFANSP